MDSIRATLGTIDKTIALVQEERRQSVKRTAELTQQLKEEEAKAQDFIHRERTLAQAKQEIMSQYNVCPTCGGSGIPPQKPYCGLMHYTHESMSMLPPVCRDCKGSGYTH